MPREVPREVPRGGTQDPLPPSLTALYPGYGPIWPYMALYMALYVPWIGLYGPVRPGTGPGGPYLAVSATRSSSRIWLGI